MDDKVNDFLVNNYLELIKERHSVRQYKDVKLEENMKEIINNFVNNINKKNNLNFQIVYDETEAFQSFLARYGKFENVRNYMILVADKKRGIDVGYYGEEIVLKLQELGLNTCWVAATYKKSKAKYLRNSNEKNHSLIAFGYGKHSGFNRRSKTKEDVLILKGEEPKWLDAGVTAALLAPTATNQQKFKIECIDGGVKIRKSGLGFYTDLDIGIVRCHFECVTGIKLKD